jgi:hypothetical protein
MRDLYDTITHAVSRGCPFSDAQMSNRSQHGRFAGLYDGDSFNSGFSEQDYQDDEEARS